MNKNKSCACKPQKFAMGGIGKIRKGEATKTGKPKSCK